MTRHAAARAGEEAGGALAALAGLAERAYGIRPGAAALSALHEAVERTRRVAPGLPASALLADERTLEAAAPLFTVPETYFFRESAHFAALESLAAAHAGGAPLRVCSAAGSTGCEAYSLAMALEAVRARSGGAFDYRIDAFDLNPLGVRAARAGRYARFALRSECAARSALIAAYLDVEGAEYVARPALRERTRFFTGNALDALPSVYDVIFFRNTLIYFNGHARMRALGAMAAALKPGGALFTGTSETWLLDDSPFFDRCFTHGAFYFRKRRPPPPSNNKVMS